MNHTEKMKATIDLFASENLEYTNECWDYITTVNLYKMFKEWCTKNHYHNCSQTVFTHNMKKIEGPKCERQREPGKGRIQNALSMFRYVKVRETQ